MSKVNNYHLYANTRKGVLFLIKDVLVNTLIYSGIIFNHISFHSVIVQIVAYIYMTIVLLSGITILVGTWIMTLDPIEIATPIDFCPVRSFIMSIFDCIMFGVFFYFGLEYFGICEAIMSVGIISSLWIANKYNARIKHISTERI